VRQYSLSNDPAELDRYVIAVLREPASRGGSAAVHEQLQAGQQITISHPRNHFELHAPARKHLLLAGGIGITPILAMARKLARDGADFACTTAAARASAWRLPRPSRLRNGLTRRRSMWMT
jgi:vanillate O-demethylase ferredoxin subunit